MEKVQVEISLQSYGNWNNNLKFSGSYEQVKEQTDLFYEKAKVSMNKVIENTVAYHNGVAKHFK